MQCTVNSRGQRSPVGRQKFVQCGEKPFVDGLTLPIPGSAAAVIRQTISRLALHVAIEFALFGKEANMAFVSSLKQTSASKSVSEEKNRVFIRMDGMVAADFSRPTKQGQVDRRPVAEWFAWLKMFVGTSF